VIVPTVQALGYHSDIGQIGDRRRMQYDVTEWVMGDWHSDERAAGLETLDPTLLLHEKHLLLAIKRNRY
jgi:hypothetical protein